MVLDNYLNLIFGILIGVVPGLLIPEQLGRKLGGHSGDSYGACVVITETIIFLLLGLLFSAG